MSELPLSDVMWLLKRKRNKSRSGIHFRKWNISRHLNVGKSKLTVFWRTGNTSAVMQNTENFCNRVKLKMPQMVGAVWHNLGTAYARLFLFEQAADCYARAYEKSSDKESLEECLMACRCNHDERALNAGENILK